MNRPYDTATKTLRDLPLALALFILALLAPSQAHAQLIAYDDEVSIEPGATDHVIPHSFLRSNDSNAQGTKITLAQDAVHGTVTHTDTTFLYTPNAGTGFSSLRGDSFSYRVSDGGAESFATVNIVLRTDDEIITLVEFEAGESIEYAPFAPKGTTLETTPQAAIAGAFGLSVRLAGPTATEAFIEIDPGDPQEPGRVDVLGCGFEDTPEPIAILTVGPSRLGGGTESLRVVLRPAAGGGVEVVVEANNGGVFLTSPSLSIGAGPSHIEVDWWKTGANSGGAILRLDGRAVSVEGVTQTGLDFSTVQIGAMPLDGQSGDPIDFHFDQFTVYEQDTAVAETLIFLEDFEDGDFSSDWDKLYGNSIDVITGSALSGRWGLLANLAQPDSYQVAEEPVAASIVNARLRIDVSTLGMAPSEILRLFDLGSDADSLFGSPDVNLRLRSLAGVVHIAAVSSEPSGLAITPWQPVTGEHVIELQWRASDGALPNGYLRLWLDGVAVGEQLHLDSAFELAEWFRLGFLGVGPGVTGILEFDDFTVWR